MVHVKTNTYITRQNKRLMVTQGRDRQFPQYYRGGMDLAGQIKINISMTGQQLKHTYKGSMVDTNTSRHPIILYFFVKKDKEADGVAGGELFKLTPGSKQLFIFFFCS